MKSLLYIFLMLLLLSCRTSVNDFYQGIVLDEYGKPLEGVTIIEEGRKDGVGTTTDNTGYFKLSRSPDWLGTLIFKKERYRTDTIPSVSHLAGEKIKYNFIENSTTIVKLKRVDMENESYSKNSGIEQELLVNLNGEWAVQNDWRDSVLTFEDTKDKNFRQEIFPTYNTIIFNKEDNTIKVETYGEFGDGTSAIHNLNIINSKWNFENGLLKLRFDYNDYSGQHHLENTYSVTRTKQQLILKKVE